MATAFTRGLQGPDRKYWEAASLLKHFLANSNEDGRGGSSSNFDTRLFHEYYAVPFRMAIEQGRADAMMTAYNAWNGIPMIENPVLREVVMKAWGFNGIVCTDGGALTNLVRDHKRYKSMAEAAAAAIHAGINQFLDDYRKPVADALAQKLITVDELDRNLRGVYRVMIRLGMLDPNESVAYSKIGIDDTARGDPWNWPTHKALARKVTAESIVLLKNNGLLPLKPGQSIAVIGPLADRVVLDWYSGTPPYTVTPLEGMRKRAAVTYAEGADEAAAAKLAAGADVAVVIIGNHPTCDAGWEKCPVPSDGKEAVDRKSLTLAQESLAKAVLAANPRTVVVLQASFPYSTTWTQEHIPAILTMTHNSEEQGDGLADVLFGVSNPAGRLTQTWVRSIDDLPPMMDYDIRHGRTYLYANQKPLYAFGFGLSYTTFAYSHLRVPATLAHDGSLVAKVDVTNTGKRDGDEVVQLYVTHRGSKVARPAQELKAFQRLFIKAGETRIVELPLTAASLAYWNDTAAKFVVEPDQIEVGVGGSSDALVVKSLVKVE